MSIDTSTTAGKIAVMQAFEDGKSVEVSGQAFVEWLLDLSPEWDWDKCTYRIKPQTVEEAAEEYAMNENGKTYNLTTNHAFQAGAEWQKEQDQ